MCTQERARKLGYCAHIHVQSYIVCSPPCQVPHYRREQIVFEVHPPSLTLTVTNDSLTVEVHVHVYMYSTTFMHTTSIIIIIMMKALLSCEKHWQINFVFISATIWSPGIHCVREGPLLWAGSLSIYMILYYGRVLSHLVYTCTYCTLYTSLFICVCVGQRSEQGSGLCEWSSSCHYRPVWHLHSLQRHDRLISPTGTCVQNHNRRP